MSAAAVTKECVWFALERCSRDDLAAGAIDLLDACGGLNADVADAFVDVLESRLKDPAALGKFAESIRDKEGPTAKLVRARLLTLAGAAEALDAYDQAVKAMPSISAPVLFQRARLLARKNRFAEAAADMQAALSVWPPYSFFVKSEKLIQKIAASGQWAARRKFKLAMVGSSTTALLAPVLRASCFRAGLDVEIYEGNYGAYQQEILDENSGLYRFEPDVVVNLLNSRDLNLPPAGGAEAVAAFCDNIRNLWSILRGRRPCHIIQIGFDTPAPGAWCSLEDSLPNGRRRLAAQANRILLENLPPGVSLIEPDKVALHLGGPLQSDVEWYSAKQYPCSGALPIFADYICSHCLAAFGLTAKVLVMDLDNTLWGGVIGEDGLGGIQIGPPSAVGEAYQDLQRYAKELRHRGVVLAACSKNNLADAELPFRRHESMVLRLEDLVALVANWNDKAANIKQIADDLSLGLDSFVFLDDNPLERAWVRSKLPQVIVPECGNTPWDMLAALRRGMYFESLALTREDAQRHESYRANFERKKTEKTAGSMDEFLAGLELEARHGPVDADSVARVTQLINKTNQFNVTTRRYTVEQVRAMADSPQWWCRQFRLADKFGDYGLIGVIIAGRSGPVWEIDTWLMSCRVLGRQMEQFMCGALLGAAKAAGAATVRGLYIPTAKNVLVKDLYPSLGFAQDGDVNRYVFDLDARAVNVCRFIRDKSAAVAPRE